MSQTVRVFWFRRDLRVEDNRGLFEALKGDLSVLPIFIFDSNILDKLGSKSDARLEFILSALSDMQEVLLENGSSLSVFIGDPCQVLQEQLASTEYKIQSIYTNDDYEPYATERDARVEKICVEAGVEFKKFKDHVIFEKEEVVKEDGSPYVVFTPFKKKWLAKLQENPGAAKSVSTAKAMGHFAKRKPSKLPTLESLGFTASEVVAPGKTIKKAVLGAYARDRDFPAIEGTTRLGVHFRFGTASIRKAVQVALKTSEVWLSELIWREFYSQILWHFPYTAKRSFRPLYDEIQWRNDEVEFEAWKQGVTGYPLVDAGMRELVQTGHMHNRVRMVTASFLTKHLLIDWRWGERFFAEHLLDFDLASNVGGWQWAAGCGTDAAPYFRVFNPETQLKKFDKDLNYVKKWVPEFATSQYPEPIVDHKMARERCLETYKVALKPEGKIKSFSQSDKIKA